MRAASATMEGAGGQLPGGESSSPMQLSGLPECLMRAPTDRSPSTWKHWSLWWVGQTTCSSRFDPSDFGTTHQRVLLAPNSRTSLVQPATATRCRHTHTHCRHADTMTVSSVANNIFLG
jgi:hypothetical protein